LTECDRVAAAIWDISCGAEFDRLLIDNIRTNLTDLIFLPIIREFEQGLCLEISKWADKSRERYIVRLESVNYVKIQNDRLLNRIDRAVRMSIKFRHIPKIFQRLGMYWLSWFDNLTLIFSTRGNL
jgi:hypothetical protein